MSSSSPASLQANNNQQQHHHQPQQLLHAQHQSIKFLNGDLNAINANTVAAVGAAVNKTRTIDLLNAARQRNTARLLLAGKIQEEEASKSGGVTYNMVAVMNEHLSASSTTNSVRSTTVSSNKAKDQKSKDKTGVSVTADDGKIAGILGFPGDFDHMYASMSDGEASATVTSALGASPMQDNESKQSDLTEVKHLKELLLLHLDLIQQQSEQIVTKDKLLAALRQENENLKLRLERKDWQAEVQQNSRSDSSENANDQLGPCSPPTLNASSNSLPSTSEPSEENQQDSNNIQHNESFKIRLNTSGGITTVKQEIKDKYEFKTGAANESWEKKKKRRSESGTTIETSKRRRGISSSSTVSNDTSSTVPESLGGKGPNFEALKKFEKKGKSLLKNKESFLTSQEHYYTAVGENDFTLNIKSSESPEVITNNLEVPSWRIKTYTSCYTMEGTENLDDEIFNKRHVKLENDERRRKRWDVQRIREQRHIEKLKKRQEKQNHHASCVNLNHSGPCLPTAEEDNTITLWPDNDQIQYIVVSDELPVSAFGAVIPRLPPCEFSLPWLSNAKSKSRRPKRPNNRRRKSSRR